MKLSRIFLLFAVASCSLTMTAQKPLPQLGKAPIDQIVKAMTLEEKAHLLVGVKSAEGMDIIANGAGTTYAIPRLGITHTIMMDGATGVRMDTLVRGDGKAYYSTGFPVATLLAATWNTDLVKRVGATMGDELLAYGGDILLAPSLNVHRNPLNGRNFEYYSEDPLLSGYMAAAATKGLQSVGVGATIKHFAANSQQTMRMFNDARVSQRALREIYLRGFEIAIREAKPWAVMSSYNRINGLHTQYSHKLLTDLLRKEWRFNGIVMTDWVEARDTRAQVHAGNDLLMGGTPQQVQDILDCVKKGTLTMSEINNNVRRVLRYIMRTPHYRGVEATFAPDLKAHAVLAREAATEGVVLLKNSEPALITGDAAKQAVTKARPLPLVEDDQVALFGLGAYKFYANGRGAADVYKPYTVTLVEGLHNSKVNLHSTLDTYYTHYMDNQYLLLDEQNTPTFRNWFFGMREPEEPAINSAFIGYRAKDCTKAIITIARNSGEAEDRDYKEGDYLLTKAELTLIDQVSKAFHAQKKPVIVVLNVGGVIDVASWRDKVDAIVMAWQPGEEGGNAVADVLTGKVCPSGRLPMTFALDYFDYPSAKNFPLHYKFNWDELLRPDSVVLAKKDLGYTNYEEDIYVGYRYFNTQKKAVAYPFGYGLSYTSFKYDKPQVRLVKGRYIVSVPVTNVGSVDGKEVVQLYVNAPKGAMEKPSRELKAFAKTRLLKAGETEVVEMSIPLADLASFNEKRMAWVTDAGKYNLEIGASVEDIRTSATITIKKPIIKSAPTKI